MQRTTVMFLSSPVNSLCVVSFVGLSLIMLN